jgi:hypothetical protein
MVAYNEQQVLEAVAKERNTAVKELLMDAAQAEKEKLLKN